MVVFRERQPGPHFVGISGVLAERRLDLSYGVFDFSESLSVQVKITPIPLVGGSDADGDLGSNRHFNC
jgi:hypothetical protein